MTTDRRPAAAPRPLFPGAGILRRLLAPRASLGAALLALTPAITGCGGPNDVSKAVVVIGVDGLDPGRVRDGIAAGELPNLAALAKQSGILDLGTTAPPQSPVAWSTFITGLDPGGHGIFDFIHREPSSVATGHTIELYLSTAKADDVGLTLPVGDYCFPLSGGEMHLLRRGKPFWDRLTAAGIPAWIYRAPGNFPPLESQAHQLSGMGTPDMSGGYGVCTLYTTRPRAEIEKSDNADIRTVLLEDGAIHTSLRGPDNTLLCQPAPVLAPFTIYLDPTAPLARIVLGDEEAILEEGAWSPWMPVTFDLLGNVAGVSLGGAHGTVRFYLRHVRPVFELYASPVNLDPEDPPLPISTPDSWSGELADALGDYATVGMPQATSALRAGIFTEADYLVQSHRILDEEEKMLDYALARYEGGFLFYYLSMIDLNCHVLWRDEDPHHPGYTEDRGKRFGPAIHSFYREADRTIGKIRDALPPDTLLIVMSDHGFAPFYRHVHLNRWLWEKGYLVLEEGESPPQPAGFPKVDWSRTKAYAVGFNGLYLNRKGREAGGILDDAAARDVEAELRRELLAIRDPKNGHVVVHSVLLAREGYHGDAVPEAPDLVVGYDRGYGSSDESALGEIPEELFRDNLDAWSGNHLMDPAVVPGVVLANRPIRLNDPDLRDLATTVLQAFGLPRPDDLPGRDLFTGK